jgi:hypothetical protein
MGHQCRDIGLIFIHASKIPPLDKVMDKILDSRASNSAMDVMPSHAWMLRPIEAFFPWYAHICPVCKLRVVKIKTLREQYSLRVDNRMAAVIPSAEADINSARKCHFPVHYDDFVVVGEKERTMPHGMDVRMERHQNLFLKRRFQRKR